LSAATRASRHSARHVPAARPRPRVAPRPRPPPQPPTATATASTTATLCAVGVLAHGGSHLLGCEQLRSVLALMRLHGHQPRELRAHRSLGVPRREVRPHVVRRDKQRAVVGARRKGRGPRPTIAPLQRRHKLLSLVAILWYHKWYQVVTVGY
jgi:hypothetical protein